MVGQASAGIDGGGGLLGPPDILGLKRVDLKALPQILSDLHFGMPSNLLRANMRLLHMKVSAWFSHLFLSVW